MHPKDAEGIASRSSLIWVCTVCPNPSVRKLRNITVDQNLSCSPRLSFPQRFLHYFVKSGRSQQTLASTHFIWYWALNDGTQFPVSRLLIVWSVFQDLSCRVNQLSTHSLQTSTSSQRHCLFNSGLCGYFLKKISPILSIFWLTEGSLRVFWLALLKSGTAEYAILGMVLDNRCFVLKLSYYKTSVTLLSNERWCPTGEGKFIPVSLFLINQFFFSFSLFFFSKIAFVSPISRNWVLCFLVQLK